MAIKAVRAIKANKAMVMVIKVRVKLKTIEAIKDNVKAVKDRSRSS